MTHEFCPDESGVCAQGKDSECPAMQPVPDGPKPGYCPTCGQYPQTPDARKPAPIASGDGVAVSTDTLARAHDLLFDMFDKERDADIAAKYRQTMQELDAAIRKGAE